MSTSSKSRPKVLVFRTTDVPFDPKVLDALGTENHVVTTVNDFVSEVSSVRPHGVIVVTPMETLVTFPSWLHDIERRSFFAGTRFAVIVPALGGQSFRTLLSTGHKDVDGFRLIRTLLHRDVLSIPAQVSADDAVYLARRIGHCLGLETQAPFDNTFDLVVRTQLRASLLLPGRLSWLEGETLLGIETSVRVQEGSSCALRFESPTGLLTVQAQSAGSDLSDLRFNFGTATKFIVNRGEMARLKAYLSRESRVNVSVGKGFRRALVVVRSPQLRERISGLLQANLVEMRTPLVWRNITTDIPRQNPHLVILEDVVLGKAKVGSNELVTHIFGLCSRGTVVVIVGSEAKAFKALDARLVPIDDLSVLEETLLARLPELGAQDPATQAGRTWFSVEAETAHCVVSVPETISAVSECGIEIQSHNTYRPLANLLINIDNSAMNFLGKCFQTLVVSPHNRATGRQTAIVRIVRGDSAKGVDELFPHALMRALRDRPGLIPEPEPAPVPMEPIPEAIPLPTVAREEPKKPRSTGKPRKRERKTQGIHAAAWFIVVLVLALLIYAITGINPPAEKAPNTFSDSFGKLFERYKRDQGEN